jgi:hypothetical protein
MKDHDEEWKSLCRQAAEEQDLEKLLRLAGRIHELLEVKQKRLQGRKIEVAILQIAYDESLLITREQLLRSRGYEVVSVMGNEDAKRLLAIPGQYYRLFIVGHAAPQQAREEIAHWLKERFPKIQVLALNGPYQDKVVAADLNAILDGPDAWLSAVAKVA